MQLILLCVIFFPTVAHMLRDVGAGRSGPITRIGMGTFVDPREMVCIC